MKTSLRRIASSLLVLLAIATPARAVQQCLVIGDSLTKEYEVEFPALYPENPDAWKARNWIETLHDIRHDWFDLGSFGVYADVRITGHKYNWAFPGGTTQELRDSLSSSSWFNKQWQSTLKSHLKGDVERVVIFAGGNDVEDCYGRIYYGSSPSQYTNRIRDNLIWIVDWVRAQRSNIPIVLVAVPHIGCAPDIKREWPTNATRTGRVTSALTTLNNQLAGLAASRGVLFVPSVFENTRQWITQPLVIGGTTIKMQSDDDARPLYAFSGDGFHPGTAVQAKIAQLIVAAIKVRYPLPAIPAITDTEILTKVLKVK